MHVSLTVTTRPLVSVNEDVIIFFVLLTTVYTSGAYEATSGVFVWMTYVYVFLLPTGIGAVATEYAPNSPIVIRTKRFAKVSYVYFVWL